MNKKILNPKSIEDEFFIKRFSTILANTYLIYLKTQNYHWNVVGDNFFMLHKFFQEQYQELAIAIDEIAERIRVLDAVAPGSFNEFLQLTTLSDIVQAPINSLGMLNNLLKDHILIIADLKNAMKIAANYEDEGSIDMLTQRLVAHEKMLWVIKSHI